MNGSDSYKFNLVHGMMCLNFRLNAVVIVVVQKSIKSTRRSGSFLDPGVKSFLRKVAGFQSQGLLHWSVDLVTIRYIYNNRVFLLNRFWRPKDAVDVVE